MRHITLINPNTNSETTRLMADIAQAAAPSGFSITGATVAEGPPLIVDETGLETAAGAVTALLETIEDNADGYIISAFGDPGLAAARRNLQVPVAGIAEAGMTEAAAGGRRFGVATTLPGLEAAIRRRAEEYGFAAQFISTRLTDGDASYNMADPARLADALEGAIQRCLDDGAEAVVIGGGPLAQAAKALAPRMPIPLIEPVPAAVRAMMRALG
jgi:Asp/Glu/hydantoin racemase